MKYRLLASMMLLFVASATIHAQDPVFSQFFASPLQLNPAFAGNSYQPHLSANYRLQWSGLSAAYNTFSVGYDQFLDKSNLGLGLLLNTDAAGDGALKTTKISGMVSYRLLIGDETYIKGGLEVAMMQKSLNWEKLVFYDAIAASGGNITPGGSYLPSSEIEPANTRRAYLDISSGFLLYNAHYYFGLAMDHLNTPADEFLQYPGQNYNGMPLRVSLHGGYQVKLGRSRPGYLSSFLSPNILYTRQAGFSQLNAGIYVAASQLIGGIWYRHSGSNGDAIIFNAGVRTREYTLGYSFDFTLSGLTISTGGSHEISVSYTFDNGKLKKSKLNDCLNLFR
ncbi:MAG: PorP/SprF family type IX secretion system membrane protein [Saprospiraceae bacterium]|nr:PorP/SprF family type IX secretion system membrane protein [Saprospiraceae bacterium]